MNWLQIRLFGSFFSSFLAHSIMVRIPTNREPTHPGEMLLEEFLEPMGITQRQLADAIHVPYQRVNELVNKKRGITPSTALCRSGSIYTGQMKKSMMLSVKLRGTNSCPVM